MKKLFFSMAALAMSLCAMAGSWTAPTKPLPTEVTAGDLVAGHYYYLQNVEGGTANEAEAKWLGQGIAWYSWATSSVLVEATDASGAANPPVYQLVYNEDTYIGYKLYDAAASTYVFISGYAMGDSETFGYGELHGDGSNPSYWDITKQESGYYRISISDSDQYYSAHAGNGYMGITKATDGTAYTSNSEPIVYAILYADNENNYVDWELLDVTSYYSAQQLCTLLNEIEDGGYLSYCQDAYNAAGAVYTKTDVTNDELEDAYATLQSAYTVAKIQAILGDTSEASTANPIDATALIVNADFSLGSMSGWTNEFTGKATNVQYQSASYTNSAYTYTNREGENTNPNCYGFIEAWTWYWFNSALEDDQIASIGDAEIYQTVDGLPAGLYKLNADVIAVQQYSTVDSQYGVELFATVGDVDCYVTASTGNGVPEHYSVTFASEGKGETCKFGLRTSNTNCNWIGADNFELLYLGEVEGNVYRPILLVAIEEAEDAYPDLEAVYADADVKEAYEEALAAAKEAYGTTDGDNALYQDARAALIEAQDALATSVSEYETAAKLLASIQEQIDEATESGKSGLADGLADLLDEVSELYESGELDSERIASIPEEMQEILANYYSEYLAAGDDITGLITNPNFDSDTTTGWTCVSGSALTWGGITNSTQTLTGEDANGEAYITQEEIAAAGGCAEAWLYAFDIQQTISIDLKPGLYQLGIYGFEDDYQSGQHLYPTAELYAQVGDEDEQSVNLMSRWADGSSCMLYGTSWSDVNTYASLSNGEYLYVPDNMAAANVYFMKGHYHNTLNFTITESAPVTIGVRNTASDDWVIVDNFSLVYLGDDASAYADVLQELIDEAAALMDVVPVVSSNEALTEAIEQADDAKTSDDCVAALQALREAIATAEASIASCNELQLYIDYANDFVLSDVDGEDDALGDNVDEFSANIDNQDFEDDDAVASAIEAMQKSIVAFVLSQEGMEDASEDNPVDITPAIIAYSGYEADGETASTLNWVSNGTIGTSYGLMEIYNQEEGTFMQQTIQGLCKGYYILGVSAFYRGTSWTTTVSAELNDPYVKYVDIYAGDTTTPMLRIMDDAEDYNTLITTSSTTGTYSVPTSMYDAQQAFENGLYQNYLLFQVDEDEADVTIGFCKTGYVEYDWTIAGNWTLQYLGTDTVEVTDENTTALEAVQATTAKATIYDLAGRKVTSAQKGVYIINGNKVIK